jgi:hypothetical protein
MDNKAAPYSHTDFQEKESILLFESRIDRRYIKTQINSRDKIPNVDGYIEIVDENNIPMYKFEIQVRTLKKDKKSYYCPLTTVNYTNVTTLPILLILVDTTQKNVYWKHLVSTNARLSPKKKSYIFDLSELDKIDEQNDYITKWKIIAENYLEKIKPLNDLELLQLDENMCPPKNLSQDAILYFQRYIDKINNLLEHDYFIVKQIYFNKYWKLGVAVFEFGKDVSFGIYGIPHGKSDLLVSEIMNKKADWMFSKKILTSFYFSKTEDRPEKKAVDFVLDFVKKIFDRKLLLPVGQKLTEEYVYFVISKCYYMFGLEKGSSYRVEDIANGLNKYLMLWISIALDFIDYPKNILYQKDANVIDIMYLANIFYFFPEHFPGKYDAINQTFNRVISGKEHHKTKENIKFYSSDFDFFIFINCLNYLKDHNIQNVEAYLVEPNYDLIKNKKRFMLLDLYTPEDRKKYIYRFYNAIQAIINEFVDYYKLPKEYKLYSNEKYHYFIIPEVTKRQMNNDSKEIAECSVIVTESLADETNNVTIIENEEYIENFNYAEIWEKGFLYDGKTYNLVSWSSGYDFGVFDKLPFYNRVYSHLQKTVEKIREKSGTSDILL